MKKTIIIALLLFFNQVSFSQVKIIEKRDMDDSTYHVKVEEMKASNPIVAKYTNKQLPSFELIDLNGKKIRSENFIGKKLHINIWSTTCKPCIQEFPELNLLKKTYEKQGYIFIAIAPENSKKISRLLAKRPLQYLIVPNAKEYLNQIEVDSYPTNFFVDENGIIKKVIVGSNQKVEIVDGKIKMVSDNYEIYEESLKGLKTM